MFNNLNSLCPVPTSQIFPSRSWAGLFKSSPVCVAGSSSCAYPPFLESYVPIGFLLRLYRNPTGHVCGRRPPSAWCRGSLCACFCQGNHLRPCSFAERREGRTKNPLTFIWKLLPSSQALGVSISTGHFLQQRACLNVYVGCLSLSLSETLC